MNIRKKIYFKYLGVIKNWPLPKYYNIYKNEDYNGLTVETTQQLIGELLYYCKRFVPYHAALVKQSDSKLKSDPELCLRSLPILTKEIITSRFDELKSVDLLNRRWYYNTSGGSTGMPVRFIQDSDYAARAGALTMLYSEWVGCEPGHPEIRLWGSERDIIHGGVGLRSKLASALTNVRYLNAFRMTPAKMREFLHIINNTKARLIVSYAQSIYELARFAEREGIAVMQQKAIMTSAGTLYTFMRDAIEKVFKCRVYDRYGSREVGNIACERPGVNGLWSAPWGVYIEIVDPSGSPVPNGTEGDILVTSLMNLAMPLVRYRIGDRGVLGDSDPNRPGQILKRVLGRSVDTFKCRDGTLVDGEYFTHLLYFRAWVHRFQFIQTDYHQVILKVVPATEELPDLAKEINDIESKIRLVLGPSCKLYVEWVKEIAPSASGKYRYTISEL